jgi:uncharacterized iron-regulated membrane protein
MSASLAPLQKRRKLLSAPFLRAMLAGHSALGLAFAALIYIVCLSGALAVFVLDLTRWEQPDAPVVAATPGPEVIASALRAGYAAALADGAAHDISLAGPLRTPGRIEIHYDDHKKGIEGDWIANEQGVLVARRAAPWSEFIGNLHMQLHLPRTWGKYLVGLTGVALFASLISGLLSHPRIFKDAFAMRWGGSRRLQEADLHNRLGVWGLPFHVVVSVTGALLGLSSLIIGVLALAAYDGDRGKAIAVLFGPPAADDETPAPLPDLAAMIREVQGRRPDAEFASAFVQHVGTAGQVVQLGMHVPGRIAFSENYRFNGDGTLVDAPESAGGVGKWILGALQPLHFGWFAGLTGKLLYGLLGLALAVVTHTGVTVWLARRRDKGRPAPHWERAWIVVGWSQPLAFATTALVSMFAIAAPLVAVYLATIGLCSIIAIMARDADWLSLTLRLLIGVCFLAVVATHAARWHATATDPAALFINIAIVLAAAAVTVPVVVNRRRVLGSLQSRRAST